MKLYHGSNVEVKEPQIITHSRLLDFGAGFYLASSLKQAISWAKIVAKRKRVGTPIISVFQFNESEIETLLTKRFATATPEWLHFVSENRKNPAYQNTWDLVIGPVADDDIKPVLEFYLSGVYSAAFTIDLLLPYRLDDQYTFRTQKALELLTWQEAIQL